jgi:hypothetical protein
VELQIEEDSSSQGSYLRYGAWTIGGVQLASDLEHDAKTDKFARHLHGSREGIKI